MIFFGTTICFQYEYEILITLNYLIIVGDKMKQIILIHTVQTMYLRFEKRLREALTQEVKIDNILDTFFSSNPNEIGHFSTENLNRLYYTLKSAELANPVCIPVVCSSLSPYVKKLDDLFTVPVLQIDKRLGDEAISKGDKITVLASAPSAANATVALIERAAEQSDRRINIESVYDIRAFHSMMRGDMETHDRVILEMAQNIKNCDVIVFAQGSIEHMQEKIQRVTDLTVVTAPQLLVEDIKLIIEG